MWCHKNHYGNTDNLSWILLLCDWFYCFVKSCLVLSLRAHSPCSLLPRSCPQCPFNSFPVLDFEDFPMKMLSSFKDENPYPYNISPDPSSRICLQNKILHYFREKKRESLRGESLGASLRMRGTCTRRLHGKTRQAPRRKMILMWPFPDVHLALSPFLNWIKIGRTFLERLTLIIDLENIGSCL